MSNRDYFRILMFEFIYAFFYLSSASQNPAIANSDIFNGFLLSAQQVSVTFNLCNFILFIISSMAGDLNFYLGIHTLCIQAVEGLARLYGCGRLSLHWLLAPVINAKSHVAIVSCLKQ